MYSSSEYVTWPDWSTSIDLNSLYHERLSGSPSIARICAFSRRDSSACSSSLAGSTPSNVALSWKARFS